MTCSIEGCERARVSRGWCATHYMRWKRNGSVHLTPYVTPPCSVEDCESPANSNGFCTLHYQRVRKYGTPESQRVSFEERFWASVAKAGDEDCWLWLRPPAVNGYGVICNGRETYAHRAAWELCRGPIPDGLTIDHLCRVRLCVNPNHLEPVTRAENTRREMRALRGHAHV